MKKINVNTWSRKEYYEFFSSFEEPFFGITSEVEVTHGYKKAKEKGCSFFIYYLYQSLFAVNSIEELRIRVIDDEVVLFDSVHASSTIGRADNTFGYSFIEFRETLDEFIPLALKEIDFVRSIKGLNLNQSTGRKDTIHYSPIPWIKFNGLTHARSFTYKDSVPKITFGKTYKTGEKLMMPVSFNAHHGLADAYHAGRYFDTFQELMG
ncbi:MAG: chloramphenicol acetyltransferase [Melioribacteraceae bacterium]|nr:MAG: chloramphenicol acetyltransferase [Melioribacteraceae bacterium]